MLSDEFFYDDPSDLRRRWQVRELGRGVVEYAPGTLALRLPPTPAKPYSDAEINDYPTRADFRHSPPLRLTVSARAVVPAGGLVGTAGFGFWNQPFAPGERGFRLPGAVWFFFAAPPNNMPLALGVPGHGWKAAAIDSRRWQFLALLPAAPLGFLLMRVPALYRRLWPVGQRALNVSEHALDPALLADLHTYTLDWLPDSVRFGVNGQTVHTANHSPHGPLGFIAWIDNQYAVVTPQGRFRFGMVAVAQEQALILDAIEIARL